MPLVAHVYWDVLMSGRSLLPKAIMRALCPQMEGNELRLLVA